MISLLVAVCGQGYILAAGVAEFNRRLASGEFAGGSSNLSLERTITRRQKLKHAGEADAADG
jgi:hypothetical protein